MEFFCAGRAVLLTSTPAGAHLWFLLTDPDPKSNQLIAVMVVSEKSFSDKTVRLEVGDHEFIQHPSVVSYGTAVPMPKSKLEAALKSGQLHFKSDMAPELLQRVRQGLLDSSRTIHVIRDECAVKFAPLTRTVASPSPSSQP